MNELDFDELDRAVSSLMNKATGKPEEAAAPEQGAAAPQIPATTPVADSTQPVVDPSQSVHQEEPVAEPQIGGETQESSEHSEAEPTIETPAQLDESDPQDEAKKKVIPHRTGRFMDMKTAPAAQPAQPAAVSRMPSRIGATLSPVVADEKPETTLPETQPQPEAPEATDAARSDFPDPIDMMTASPDEQAQTTDTADTAESKELEKLEEEPDTTPDNAPESESANSPFLADAKPEKRPLGTPLGSVEPTAESIPGADTVVVGKDGEPQLEDEIAIPAPPEYDTALVALESGDVEKEVAEPTKEEPQETTPDQEDEALLPSPTPAESTPVKPTGPVSIQQQYDEQPSSGPGESGAIFDTASYHKPLDHPAKKSHGLMWVIFAVIVILLGGAAGAAFYLGYI